jgi:hypothetical protein
LINWFIDSGAFSVKKSKVIIDLQDYISFLKEFKQFIAVYANLDVIGDAKVTLRNQRIMEKAGLTPLPVFHYGEDFKYLEFYVKNYEYIGIGGRKDWFDHIWSKYLCDREGWPKLRVHGFAITSFELMTRYPFYSVDSSSWVKSSRYGFIYVPKMRKGKYVYDESALKLRVTQKLTPDDSDYIKKYLIYLNQRKKDQNDSQERMKIYLVTETEKAQGTVLNKCGVKNRLISYAFLQNKSSEFIRYFLKAGIPPDS